MKHPIALLALLVAGCASAPSVYCPPSEMQGPSLTNHAGVFGGPRGSPGASTVSSVYRSCSEAKQPGVRIYGDPLNTPRPTESTVRKTPVKNPEPAPQP